MRTRTFVILMLTIVAGTALIYKLQGRRGAGPTAPVTLEETSRAGQTAEPVVPTPGLPAAVAPAKAIPKAMMADAKAAIADGRLREEDISDYLERRLNARPQAEFEGQDELPGDDFNTGDAQ